jgi:hypothetical protein
MRFERLREAGKLSVGSRQHGYLPSTNKIGIDSKHLVRSAAYLSGLVRAHKLLNRHAVSSM